MMATLEWNPKEQSFTIYNLYLWKCDIFGIDFSLYFWDFKIGHGKNSKSLNCPTSVLTDLVVITSLLFGFIFYSFILWYNQIHTRVLQLNVHWPWGKSYSINTINLTIHIHTHIHACIHAYIHTCIHTGTYIHTYIHA